MAKSRFTISLALILSLIILVPADTAASAQDKLKWSEISIPTDGEAGGWVLASGSDVRHLAMATDGTLYAYVEGLTYTLYKSTDSGYSWSHCGKVSQVIVDIATPAGDASVIYYASPTNVYKSTDAGQSFQPLAANPAVASGSNIEITSIDVAQWDEGNIIVAGTRDTDAGQYGGVYVLKEQTFAQWLDTDIGDYDVYAVAFSPGFTYDQQIVAVVTDETDSFVTTGMGSAGWSQTIGDARLDRDNSGASIAVSISADISFPDDYNSDLAYASYIQFVAVDTGSDDGDVYMIYGGTAPGSSEAIDLDIGSSYGLSNIDVTSLAISGNAATAHLLAGVANDGQVYHSYDGGESWERSLKEPTGQSQSDVIMDADFPSYGKAYAATSGSESAFSVTLDGGNTWNQFSMIDTRIDNIIDLAISPEYSQDRSLFMLTWSGEFSLWLSLDGGALWQRLFSSILGSIDSIDMVELSPKYGDGSQVLFLAGVDSGNPAIWQSDDNGQSFFGRSAPLAIDQWAVADNATLFIAGYNGSNGLVYHTENSGRSYSSGTVVGDQAISCLALSPEYAQDGTILVGNSNGWIYWSDDKGNSFEPLPLGATLPPLTGNISVTFDTQFGSNSTVYAASDTPDEGIYRFTISDSTDWENIDSTLPSRSMIGGLVVSADATLYASNFQQVDTENDKGGMERCLKPTSGTTFETVTRGLNDGATLFGLWLCGNRLWSIDTTNIKLMSYIDSLTQPVSLSQPYDQAPGIGTIIDGAINDVSLDWEPLDGATSYQWQLDDDNDFSSVPTGFEGNTTKSSVELPTLEPATTYYWRVRATKPVLSPWSDKWSFTTSLGGEIVAPRLESPQPGATEVAIKPIFQWSAVAGAESYELMVSGNLDFSYPIILRVGDDALPGNAWQSDVSLSYGTTYYWKVRALSQTTNSAWSAVGVFTTETEKTLEPETVPKSEPNPGTEPNSEPEPTFEPELASEPTYEPEPSQKPETTVTTIVVESPSSPTTLSNQTSQTTPDWLFYVMVSMGIIIILLLAAILVLVIKRR